MGQKHSIIERDELVRHARLVLEHVETRRQNCLAPQRLDQRLLIDQRAARDIDQNTIGTERLQHFGIDDMARRGAAGRDHDQNV